MTGDRSEGWEAAAPQFMAARSAIGASLVRSWAQRALPSGASIVDVGCGSGIPITEALFSGQFQVWGIDASAAMIAAFRDNFPHLDAVCEAAQDSDFFGRKFDGAISIGLLFLLQEEDQARVLHRVSGALVPGGRFLFSAPVEACAWQDSITGRQSRSLGKREYERLLNLCGLNLVDCLVDEGENTYFDAVKVG